MILLEISNNLYLYLSQRLEISMAKKGQLYSRLCELQSDLEASDKLLVSELDKVLEQCCRGCLAYVV